jgi:hypothetical protein
MKEFPQPFRANAVSGEHVIMACCEDENLPQVEWAAPCDDLASDDTMYVDWDVKIENPPIRRTRTVLVRFVAGGRRLPNLPDDPRD